MIALRQARFPWPGPRGRKWGFTCAHCRGKFIRNNVEVDHIIPCGSLKTIEDLPAFIARALPEDPKAFQVLCKQCHGVKTLLDNEARNGT
jgi:5-methylcytosine-specific restriction endonuclease McrA